MSKKKKNRWSLTQLPLSESIPEIIMSISQIIFNLRYIHHAMQLWQSVFFFFGVLLANPLSKKKNLITSLSEPISEICKFKVHIQTIHNSYKELISSCCLYVHVPCLQLVKANS